MTRVPEARSGVQDKEGGVAAFRLLEHTADMGIEAWAPASNELFVQAARGLLAVLGGDGETSGPLREMRFTFTAGDLEELLVVWLNELLYLIQSKGLWPVEITVTGLQPGEMNVRLAMAPVGGPPQREVKAVTYHHLLVSFRQGLWRARVYLDL